MHKQVLNHIGAQCPFSGACFKIHTIRNYVIYEQPLLTGIPEYQGMGCWQPLVLSKALCVDVVSPWESG